MTDVLYRDAYLREATGRVDSVNERGGIVLDASVFYPTGGGQPGDCGLLRWEGGQARIATTVKDAGRPVLVPEEGATLPALGTEVRQVLDWDRRYAHMRVHTALHLLSVVIPLPVTGGSISAGRGRLDFDMPEPPDDREALTDELNTIVARNLEVGEVWITEQDLDASPGLVKTMSVQPPRGTGRIRLVRIGIGDGQVDLQPCGGTHVAMTGEIGQIRLGKIEKKGARNRRVYLHLDP
ncbi:MAG: alanyl-tRNA editing protein [Boseongicola sp. SB0675_bin_26]|nr:alanyl-tRNA editing protein [Boseongicola sp. SB0675_bin_26]